MGVKGREGTKRFEEYCNLLMRLLLLFCVSFLVTVVVDVVMLVGLWESMALRGNSIKKVAT